ncbi:MAG: ribonuclease HI family protein [Candidatus Blackburnbacteria bacterium]|nr:ribonuclease HI family protein [Candidatus Blackburnbacteria bacterium]
MMSLNLRVFCDGGARGNPGPAASAFVVMDGENVLTNGGKYLGYATNNVAEYSAVIFALEWLVSHAEGAERISFFLDSQLIVKQLSGEFRIKDQKLLGLVLALRKIERQLGVPISYQHIPRSQNKLADALVNKILDENR